MNALHSPTFYRSVEMLERLTCRVTGEKRLEDKSELDWKDSNVNSFVVFSGVEEEVEVNGN